MRNNLARVIFSILFCFPGVAFSQDGAASDSGQQSEAAGSEGSKPYEIVITPMVTRSDLRTLIQDVEDDFFAKFNELNIDDDYDIVCYKHTPTMSHIPQRVCEPLFLIRARGSNASESAFLSGSQGKDAFNQARGSAFLDTPDIMKRMKKRDFDILQEKMEELNRTNDELRSIGSVLAQLKSRLENFGKDE